MPVLYSEIQPEHHAVRKAAGVFDLCHMGRYRVTGKDAATLLGRAQTSDPMTLAPGRTRYALFLNEQGGVIDDILISREADGYLLVVNAGNRDVGMAHLLAQGAGLDAQVLDDSDRIAMVAVQGPKAAEILTHLGMKEATSLGYYRFSEGETPFGNALISRTGYTGEDGFEVLLDADIAELFFLAALEAGKPLGALPCGLGARDTLRLEAGMPLYGHEMDATTNPFEAAIDWAIRTPAPYVGRDAIEAVRASGPRRRLVGLTVEGPRIPRQGCRVLLHGTPVGEVLSGTMSPTLACNIATARVDAKAFDADEFVVEIRKDQAKARKTALPFYKRERPA